MRMGTENKTSLGRGCRHVGACFSSETSGKCQCRAETTWIVVCEGQLSRCSSPASGGGRTIRCVVRASTSLVTCPPRSSTCTQRTSGDTATAIPLCTPAHTFLVTFYTWRSSSADVRLPSAATSSLQCSDIMPMQACTAWRLSPKAQHLCILLRQGRYALRA